MKTRLVIVVGFLSIISSFMAFAESDRKCTQTGTWYGGSYNDDHEGYKYQYTFIPTKPGRRFSVTADGVYNPDTLGAAEVATTWTGEMVKKPSKAIGGSDDSNDGSTYEIRLIALTSTDPIDPPEVLPMIWAVKGDVRFDGCNTLMITYDWFAVYTWEKVPFVDEPDMWVLNSGQAIDESIKRMPMNTKLPTPP